jgi:hypothetical protein
MTKDEVKRATILLTLIVLLIILSAIVAPCDGACTLEEEARSG